MATVTKAKKTLTQAKKYLMSIGIYDVVNERMLHHRRMTFEQIFPTHGDNSINFGILWDNTPEGHRYWDTVHNKFVAWYNSNTNNNEDIKSIFKEGQKVTVLKKLSSNIVDINEDMMQYSGKNVTITCYEYGYNPQNGNEDGLLYYIKEDGNTNVWTSELFKPIKQ